MKSTFNWDRPTTRSDRVRSRAWHVAAHVPGLKRIADRPRREALSAGTYRLVKWTSHTDYGVPGKPRELLDIPWDYIEENKDQIPFFGLREHWYPVFPSKELKNNLTKPFTILGDHVVFFRDREGKPRALADRCPHRSAMLSLGQVGVFEPGTISCRYHGWTFDGDGQCVAALTDGPESRLVGRAEVRSYPVEDIDGLVWIYMGVEDPGTVYDKVPHARSALSRPWKYRLYWDWPLNYLQAMDNLADPLHPSVSHADCALYKDQAVFDRLKSDVKDDCGGLEVIFQHDGPGHRGTRAFDVWEVHVPGYLYVPMVNAGLENHNGMFWAVPLDIGKVRMFDISSYGGPIAPRVKERIKHQLLAHKWGLPTSIYWCNKGPDQAMLLSQGRVADRRIELRARSDQPLVKWREMMKAAHVREQAARAEREQAALDQPVRVSRRSGPVASSGAERDLDGSTTN